MLYGIGAAQNAWTLSEMVRFDLARIEELDVGACFDIRYRARGAPPSHLVRPVDCSRPHSAEVVGIHPTNVSAHQDAAALERLAEQACDRANDLFRGKAGKLLVRDFTQQAPIKHVAKDIRLICEEARGAGIAVPAAIINAELFATAVEMDLGEDDAVGVLQVLEALAQRDVTTGGLGCSRR